MRTRSFLVPMVVALLATACEPGTVAGGPPSTTGPATAVTPTRTATSTTLAAPPPTAELVQGYDPTDCPVDAVVARARPAAPTFPRGGSVTIYVTLTATVDCRWRPMEFWRPVADVQRADGALVWRPPMGAPGVAAAVMVQLRAGQEVLVRTVEWDERPSDSGQSPASLPLVAVGRYRSVATIDGITAADPEPFEVVG